MSEPRPPIGAFAILVAACWFHSTASGQTHVVPGAIPIQHALVIDSVGQYGRAPIHRDAIQQRIAAGTWAPPTPGESITAPDGSVHTWEALAASEQNVLAHRSLRGGYASATVESDAERVLILEASGHNMLYVNGEPRAGDPYGYGFVHLPVLLRAGTNELLFHGGREGAIAANLVPPPADVFISPHDMTLPDFLAGETSEASGAVVLINATTTPMDDLVLRVRSEGPIAKLTAAVGPLPALSIRKVGFPIAFTAPPGSGAARFTLELVRGAGAESLPVLDSRDTSIRVRGVGQSIKRTFISEIDGSVQYFAHRPALKAHVEADDSLAELSLILSLHGASVEATSQADAYAPKEWAHLVAPTNRRPFGFDWEDWGRLDALEVLDLSMKSFGIDPARVYLTGHSMGGHGTWHLGATYPDRFAAIGPSAGWVSFWSYAGGAQFDDSSPIEATLHRATASSDTLVFAENLKGLGVYVLHGSADDNVPVDQARTVLGALAGFHGDFVFAEQTGAGHWWDGDASAGADCVDWPDMMEYFQRHARPSEEEIRHVRFATVNPGVSATRDWVTIESQITPLTLSTVDLRRDLQTGHISGTTANVARLSIDMAIIDEAHAFDMEIDGEKIVYSEKNWSPGRVHLQRDEHGWSMVARLAPDLKGPHRNGLFKDAFRNRALLVYGTGGDALENAWAFAKARFDSETFWYRGNGSFEMIADADFDPAAEPDRNIILYGNADTNSAWSALLDDSPIEARRTGLSIEGRLVPGDDLGAIFIRPRPGSDVASVGVVTGTGVRGCRLTDRLSWFVSGVAYPDFLVIGPEAIAEGYAGIRVAGFFANDWSINPANTAWGEGR